MHDRGALDSIDGGGMDFRWKALQDKARYGLLVDHIGTHLNTLGNSDVQIGALGEEGALHRPHRLVPARQAVVLPILDERVGIAETEKALDVAGIERIDLPLNHLHWIHGSSFEDNAAGAYLGPVSYTHLTLPTNREV